MSKSPSSQIFLPALGGAALVLGVAYGVSNRDYGNTRIAALEDRIAARETAVADLSERAAGLETELAELRSASESRIAALTAEVAAATAAAQDTAGASAPVSMPAPAADGVYGLGRPAHPAELAAWDVDVLPDGRGLPEGSGDVLTGEEVFSEKCASCHGDFAEGRGNWPVLAGGFDTLDDPDPVKTVGSYWPYLSTVWDYVHRSMPFGNAGTLTNDEVYAITAYILYSNFLVDDDFTLSKETFASVEMNNTDGFIVDDRPDAEYAQWRGEPCMETCKPAPAQITRRSTDVGVTPADDGSMAESVMEAQLAALGGTEWGANRVAGSVFMNGEPEAQAEDGARVASADTTSGAPASDAPDPALVAKGEVAFKKCTACHAVGDGAKNKVGPQLNGILGRTIGAIDGFKYSNAFLELGTKGKVWETENLSGFLADPKGYVKGTKMSFAGFRDEADIAAVIAYLSTFGD